MSGYHYDPTAEENEAAALLGAKGWGVKPPTCPECHGLGGRTTYQTWTSGGLVGVLNGASSAEWLSCSRGCERPAWYFPVTGIVDPVRA